MHHSTYAIETDYLLPDSTKMMDTVTVVLIQDGKVMMVDKYVFVERKTMNK
jgi:hypothetical protein